MQLHRFDNAREFYDRTQAYLLVHAAEHNLLLGILHSLVGDSGQSKTQPCLVTVEANGKIAAVAIRTPPFNLVLSKIQDFAALDQIAQNLVETEEPLPGVNALTHEAKAFAEVWQAQTGKSYRVGMQLQINQLTAVRTVARARGDFRCVEERDRALLLDWYSAFSEEALHGFQQDIERWVDRDLTQKMIYLWMDRVPVSIAAGSKVANFGRIGPVYTPPEYRRKGYATSCVAALSQTLLDQGCDRCFLFTDVANPTSNHVYQTIGYQAICDWNEYKFET